MYEQRQSLAHVQMRKQRKNKMDAQPGTRAEYRVNIKRSHWVSLREHLCSVVNDRPDAGSNTQLALHAGVSER
jgi:hypothetical protein